MASITAQAQSYTRMNAAKAVQASTCVVTNHNWFAGSSDQVDFRAQLPGLRLQVVAGCYVDNSQNNSALRIFVPSPAYFIDVPAGYCGYFPVFMLSLQPVTITNVSGSTGLTEIVWVDEEIEPAIWSGGQGNLAATPVMDSSLEAALRAQAGQNTSLRVTIENNGTDILAAQDGTDANGSVPMAGGVGIRGWLSSIYQVSTPLFNSAALRGPGGAAATYFQVGASYTAGGVALQNGQGTSLQLNATGYLLTSDAILDAVSVSKSGGVSNTALQIGGVYNNAQLALQNGQGAALQLSPTGSLYTYDAANTSVNTPVASPAQATQVAGKYTAAGVNLANNQAAPLSLNNVGSLMTKDTDLGNTLIVKGGSTNSFALQVAGVYNSPAPVVVNGQGIALQVTSSGSLITSLQNVGSILTDASVTNLAAASTQVIAANLCHNYLLIQTKATSVAINWGAAAAINTAGSIDIPANSTFKLNATDVIPAGQALNMIAATAGASVTIKYV